MEHMTVGVLAQKANVTVRTLQYYDKMGLLKPSSISEGGRRLYTTKDMMILHQIITFKNLGLSLDEIKNQLMPINSNEDMKNVLLKQAELMKEQILKTSKVIESIEMIIADVDFNNSIDWSKYSNMMQLIHENNESYWVLNYLENDVLERIALAHEHFSEEELPSDWLLKCMKKAKFLLESGCTPESDEVQELVEEILTIFEKYAKGEPLIEKKLFEFFRGAELWPSQYAQMQKAVRDFLEEAMRYHLSKGTKASQVI